jgi:DNA-directed RNA polymerase specialized sigma24 family protein
MHAQFSQQVSCDGYELFRRAIVERDEQAWIESAARYRPMLISWVIRCGASGTISEHCGDIADRALARAWKALIPERFVQIPTLAALLAYLRTCVKSVVIDCARSEAHSARVAAVIEVADVVTPEQLVLDRLQGADLWKVAIGMAQTTQQQVVLIESYGYALSPRVIHERHPDLFANAAEISATKRYLLERLKRSPQIQQFYREWMAA